MLVKGWAAKFSRECPNADRVLSLVDVVEKLEDRHGYDTEEQPQSFLGLQKMKPTCRLPTGSKQTEFRPQ